MGCRQRVAAAGGPVLGGLLTEHVGWRSIFLVDLPVSAVTIALTLACVRASRRTPGARPDVAGMCAFTVCAGALTYSPRPGLIRAGDDGFGAAVPLGMFGPAAVALAVFVAVERRKAHPLLDLGLFRSPSFTAIVLGGMLLMASAFACLAFTSVWLQAELGLGPVRAGLPRG